MSAAEVRRVKPCLPYGASDRWLREFLGQVAIFAAIPSLLGWFGLVDGSLFDAKWPSRDCEKSQADLGAMPRWFLAEIAGWVV